MKSRRIRGFMQAFVFLTLACLVDAQARPAARQSPEWLRDAVIYEVFPRAFSAQGNFQGVIPQLDRLKALGVNVIWLMPIHPVGREKAKGSLGSPYAVRDYEAVNPEYGSRTGCCRCASESHACVDIAAPLGVQGFPAGEAVNTYACDCQMMVMRNILAPKGSLSIFWGSRAPRDPKTIS